MLLKILEYPEAVAVASPFWNVVVTVTSNLEPGANMDTLIVQGEAEQLLANVTGAPFVSVTTVTE